MGGKEIFVLCLVLLDDVSFYHVRMLYNVIRKYQMIQVFSTYVESLSLLIQFSEH